MGRERSNSAAKQPPPSPPVPVGKETKKEVKKEPASRKVNLIRKVVRGDSWSTWSVSVQGTDSRAPE